MTATALVEGKLSSIMTASAKIAMPEVVSVFISKYETDLYNAKSDLQKRIAATKKDIELLDGSATQKADFSKYAGEKLPGLKLVTYVSQEVNINWDEGTFTGHIGLQTIVKAKEKAIPHSFVYQVQQPVPKAMINERQKLREGLGDLQGQLQGIIGQISDMSRKERQIKARISELRLKEEGLEGFLQDKQMASMLAIDYKA